MFNACYGAAVGPDRALADRRHDAHVHRRPRRRRRPALLQAHRARPLPALQPPTDLPRRRPARRRVRRQPGPEQRLGRRRCRRRAVPLPDPRQGLPDRQCVEATVSSTATLFRLRLRSGCTAFPEISTNVSGNPFAGVSGIQEVRGFIDAHTHGMAFEFLGGEVHCGRPWSPYGVEAALRTAPTTSMTGGKGALMEAFLSGKPTHDPVGWPTFKDWPAPELPDPRGHLLQVDGALLARRPTAPGQPARREQQALRALPAQAQLCDDMDSIRLQAKQMRALQDYVDAQSGGPGKGWYRIVTTPDQARKVINAGKLAVVMGIETSVPFGCTQKLGVPDLKCTRATIDRQLDEVRKMGVSQMELVNKFDNALSGVAGDEGSTGYLVNSANTLETGSPWRMQTCSPTTTRCTTRTRTTPSRWTPPRSRRRTPSSARSPRSPASTCPAYPLPGQAPLQHAGPHRPRRAHHPWTGQAAHALRPRPHEREGAQGLAGPDRAPWATAASSRATPGRPPMPIPGSTSRRASSRRTPATATGFVDEVEAPPDLGQPRDLLGLRVRCRHQRPRRPGRPAPGRRDRTRSPTRSPRWVA